jgi:hypothetical protein
MRFAVDSDEAEFDPPILDAPTAEQWHATNRQSFRTVLHAANRGDSTRSRIPDAGGDGGLLEEVPHEARHR